MKLLIAVPSGDYLHVQFVKSLTSLLRRLERDGIDYELDIHEGSLVYIARDQLACKAINEGFSHVLWLDSDMVFNDDLLEDLQFSGEDFVTGICAMRRPPYTPALFSDLDTITRMDKIPSQATFRVAGCGFACVLILTDILRGVWMKYGTCFNPTDLLGEDTAMCWRAAQMGYQIWAEPAVKVGHLTQIPIYPGDGERLMG